MFHHYIINLELYLQFDIHPVILTVQMDMKQRHQLPLALIISFIGGYCQDLGTGSLEWELIIEFSGDLRLSKVGEDWNVCSYLQYACTQWLHNVLTCSPIIPVCGVLFLVVSGLSFALYGSAVKANILHSFDHGPLLYVNMAIVCVQVCGLKVQY